MGYRTLRECVQDLQRHGHLVAIDEPVDADLEAAEIHRRVFQSHGPAIWFRNVRNCRFTMVSNLFGTMERMRFIFRDTLKAVQQLIQGKVAPEQLLRSPWRHRRLPWTALHMLPRRRRGGPVLAHRTTLDQLPQLRAWPLDGGAFIMLPAVYTEHPRQPGWRHSNLGMYRVQLSGGNYRPGEQIGLHYQIHRGIGVHHTIAGECGRPLKVNIFVGGAPAMTVAAVMPLPESVPEVAFAGALAGHRIPLVTLPGGPMVYGEADFCIRGEIEADLLLPEGPFGDHLGYYSLAHDFPVLKVLEVTHRSDAIWPFTIVGRPPQEDTMFGQLIHEITGPIIPRLIPGVKAVHAVDAAGVHPLMLAIGSERYTPFLQASRPQELLTQANAILGQGQMSLAKYLLIVSQQDDPDLRVDDIPRFFQHLLARVDWSRDLHFQTATTIDTLDYSGRRLNEGSKLVIAAVGPPRRELLGRIPPELTLPEGFDDPRVVLPGILALRSPKWSAGEESAEASQLRWFAEQLPHHPAVAAFPLVVLVDDSAFTARSLENFLWTTFTRSDPASDIDGQEAQVRNKHWGCRGTLVIDARFKSHYPPPLEPDPETVRRIDALAAQGLPISRYL